MDMRPLKTKRTICIWICTILCLLSAAVFLRQQKQVLVVEETETGKIYAEIPIKAGEELCFEWEHSFEHIPWYEYYEVQRDGSFILHTIAVAGFGAGIPAEMDCSYRYEDGLIYMEGIESCFPEFHWIHSQTALKSIRVGGNLLLSGPDMPHHKKMTLRIQTIQQGFWRKERKNE
jgi:hypothetical protein